MSIRGLVCAFAVLGAVEASLMLPQVSSAQLAETMTATGIQGQLQSMQKSNILAPGRKARGIAGVANQKRAYEREVLEEGTAQTIGAASIAPFDENSPVKGKTYAADGTVVSDGMLSGQRVVMVLKMGESNSFQVMAFRLQDPTIPAIPKNTPVHVTAVYNAKVKEPKSGMLIHGFSNAVFQAGQAVQPGSTGGQAPAPAEVQEEKPTFSSIMKGWVLRGTVQMNGKATAVFVNEDRVKYAKVGTVIEKGLRVVKVKNGEAGVVVDGERFDVTPW